MRKTLSFGTLFTIVAVLLLAIGLNRLPPRALGQNKGTPLSTAGVPAPMMYDTSDPVTASYPCDTSHTGIPFYNMVSGVARPIWICNGTTWIQAQPAISGATVSFGGSLVLLGSSVSQTATVNGAVTGNNCIATRADGTLLAVGLAIDCNVPSANTANVRISALIAGTPTAGIYNIRVIQ